MKSPANPMAAVTHRVHPTILREYDIRGIVGETLFPEDARAIGQAFGTLAARASGPAPRICVGRDGRLSSPELEQALVDGLMESGAQAVRIGLGPTPMLYYSVYQQQAAGGIMVTGSHNPPTHNGFKFMLGSKPFYGRDILKLGEMVESGDLAEGRGAAQEISVLHDYIERLVSAYRGNRELAIAWDAGNGATGEVMQALCERLPGTHIALNAKIDGTFPAHHPDPTVPKNLEQLIDTVRKHKCDAGVAFDGDGDRIGVVDGEGEIVWGDQLLSILASEVLRERPGATIIADVKASQSLFDEITRMGGQPLMWKTGHSLIKAKMAETKSPLAGEMSGHVFFADHYYGYDDGLYAAVRLVSLLASGSRTLSDLRSALPKCHNTPELRIPCDEERKFLIIEEVRGRLKQEGAAFSEVDGVRVNRKDGWWLLRASNTQAVLVARAEGESPEAVERLTQDLQQQLALSGVTLP